MDNRDAMLKRVQVYDFALYEARLFLDTHPSCKEALDYYNKHLEMAKAAKEAFEAKYGPLMAEDNKGDSWEWIKDPWPWENNWEV